MYICVFFEKFGKGKKAKKIGYVELAEKEKHFFLFNKQHLSLGIAINVFSSLTQESVAFPIFCSIRLF
jgi:hypothetical protein